MRVAWKQCSENPRRAYRPFVANCNSMRRARPRRAAPGRRRTPCAPRNSARQVDPRSDDRSALPRRERRHRAHS
ncbi:hypothetical protein C6Q21_29195 [Burkholderia multivorans]|nr:hypothetical protein C6Q21_29195 [Burkholderia multivorans]